MMPDNSQLPPSDPVSMSHPVDPVPLSAVKQMKGPYIMLGGVILLIIAFVATSMLPASNIILLLIAASFLLALIGMVVLCFELSARSKSRQSS